MWQQDIRWSLLGFVLDRGGGDKAENVDGEEGGGAEQCAGPRQSYLNWIEVALQVTFTLSMFQVCVCRAATGASHAFI